MNTCHALTNSARQIRRQAKGELADRNLSVTSLAQRIGKSRNAVSRAINRGEFPAVWASIKKELGL